jgi:hypothetical protein
MQTFAYLSKKSKSTLVAILFFFLKWHSLTNNHSIYGISLEIYKDIPLYVINKLDSAIGTGKSLSEALIFGEPRENMLCRYINCYECQNQFLYTTCSPHVLSLAFSRIELVIQ